MQGKPQLSFMLLTGLMWYYFFDRREKILTKEIVEARKRRGRSFNFWKTRCSDENKQWDEMKKGRWASPAGKKGVRGLLLLQLLLLCCCGPSLISDHGRTDQLEDRNIIFNSKLILASNDYWNKIKPHHRNLQTIGFQNLLELTQDLQVVVLKDHEFLSHISMYTFMMGSKKQHNLRKNPWSFNTTARYWVDSSKFRKPIVCRFMR